MKIGKDIFLQEGDSTRDKRDADGKVITGRPVEVLSFNEDGDMILVKVGFGPTAITHRVAIKDVCK